MKRLRTISFLVLAFVFYDCDNHQLLKDDTNFEVISVNPKNAIQQTLASKLYSSFDYIQLETEDNNLIGEISQILPYKNRLYILDKNITQTVFCFQKDGKFLFKINSKGRGPKEYSGLSSISINKEKEQLLLHCSSPGKIQVYDLNGKFIRSNKLYFMASRFTYIRDGYCAFFCDFGSNGNLQKGLTNPNLIITKSDNFKINSLGLPFPAKRNVGAISMMANCFSSCNSDFVSMLVPYNDTIFQISSTNIKAKYLIDFGKKNKDSDFYSMLFNPTSQLDDVQHYINVNNICYILSFIETSEQIFFLYRKKNMIHFVHYWKNNKQIIDVFSEEKTINKFIYPILNDIDGGPFILPSFADSLNYYSVIQPYELIDYKDKIIQSQALERHKLIQILDNISQSNNPIIAIISPLKTTIK